MSLPKYPQYKDSGVAWLGEIPRHWVIRRVRDIAVVINGYPFDSALFSPDGEYPLIRIRDLNSNETATRYSGEFVQAASVTPNDVLIGMDGDFEVGRWFGDEAALLNQRMCCIRVGSRALSTLLLHALPTPLKAINDVTYSTTVKHLSSLDVEKIRIALPEDYDELLAIAAFLDREIGKIDALIAEQEKLLILLAEKRQATISHAVTRGFNPDAPVKDSGYPWMPSVPAHWAVAGLSYFASVENGTTPSRDVNEYWQDGTIPWLASGEVNQLHIRDATEFITDAALNNCSLRLLPVGTVIVGMIGQGKTRGMSARLLIPATINQNLAAICPGPRLDGGYLLYVFHAVYEWLREAGRGGNQAAMNCQMLSSLRIPVPPVEEQRTIVAFIEAEATRLDALKAQVERAIDLLRERRSALIAAAVTGKIDVRDAVPQELAA